MELSDQSTLATAELIDGLSYSYQANQLREIADNGSAVSYEMPLPTITKEEGFKDGNSGQDY